MFGKPLIAFIVCSTIVLGLSSPRIADAQTSVAGASPFLVTYDGASYHADSQSTSSSYTGTLKFVVESAVGELNQGGGGTVSFAAGTFDYGSEFFKGDQIHNITFQGQGIDVTMIQNSSSDAADTEPFNFSGAFGVTVRDMTVSAGGPVRPTSDAIDFDQGNDSLVERVKITASRGRGIVFDGKNAGWTSSGNVVRDCVIDGVSDSGVEFLASTNNLIERCTITNAARHGIEASKSSVLAPQPNKKASNNIIRDNIIDSAGLDGIFVNSSDGNQILANRVTNSSKNVAAADGVRITSIDSITCDDNIVDGNVATDTQATKKQRYGLNIDSPLCNRTVVGGGNDFSGNRVGPINDLGTATQYAPDTLPPTAPTGLSATGVYRTQIDLAWTASTDSVGVTAYEVWRDDSLLATIGAQTRYSDTTVAAGSTHGYQVRARDAANNVSGSSNSASATTPTSGILFHEGFESGDLSKWTSTSGLLVQQQDIFSGSWAARAAGTNTAAFATRVLGNSESDLYWQVHFKVLSQSTNANLLRFRTATNASILTAFVSTTDRIGYRNDVTGISTTSTAAAARGSWHTLQLRVLVNGAAGQTEVWLDGTKIAALSATQNLGSAAIGRLELGDSAANHSFDVAFDDVDYDRTLIPDLSPPTVPASLAATPRSGFRVDLSWTGSSDDSGVSAYEIYRGGSLVATAPGAATSYADASVSPLTSYSYSIRAQDAAGNVSGFSNTAFATTGDAFADNFESGDLSKWTSVTGLSVQQTVVDGGQWAAQATSDGTAGASAAVQLDQPVSELYYRARFRIASQGPNSVSLLRFRTAQNGPLVSAFVSNAGKLGYRNDTSSTFITSTQSVSRGVWHELQMHLLAGGPASQVEVWLDGVKVMAQTDALGGAIGRLELGDSAAGRAFDVAFDSIVADPIFIADAAVPTAPQNLRSTGVTVSGVDLAWDQASDDVGITTYRVTRNGAPVADVDGSTLTYADTGLSQATQFAYTVTALDAVGHASAASNVLLVTTVANPDMPAGLTAAAVPGQGVVNLSWAQPANTAGVAGYRIYRDSSPTAIGTVDGVANTSYVDSTVAPATVYTYRVTAVDGAGNESDPSEPATVTSSDIVAPTAPSGLTAATVTGTRVELNWSAATDNVGVTGYRIYRNGSAIPIDSVAGATTSYVDLTVSIGATYAYTVTAVDAASNESAPSNSATATDTVPPSAPSGLAAMAISDIRVDLSWTAATDNVAVTGYRIYRDGSATPIGTVSGFTTTFSDSGGTAETTYTYTVKAVDAAGSESGGSNAVTAATLKQGWRGLAFAASDDTYVRADTPTKNFGSATTVDVDNSPVKQGLFKFAVSGIGGDQIQSAKLRIYCLDGSDVGGIFSALADPAASWSQGTVTWNNAPPADSAPFAALGKVVVGTWYEVDVQSLVIGDGSFSLRVASSSTRGARYSSTEGSARFSPQLVVVVAPPAVPDTTPPSEPTGLHIVSSSPTQVALGWTASTDDVRVSNYRISRNGAVLATSAAVTGYTDTTVAPLTHYTYNVQALDPSGNPSLLSNTAAVDTPAPPPVLTFTPTDDASIRADKPAAQLGAAARLDVDNSPVKHVLLRFSINGIGSQTVTNAKLRIHCVDPSSSGGEFHLLASPAPSWSESSVTWNTAPGADPTIVGALGRVVIGTWYEVDLTSLVTADGLLELRVSSPSMDGAGYSSKEGSLAPQLVVTLSGP